VVTAAFRFDGEWTISGPPDTVAAVLADLGTYPTWWPQIRAVASLGPRDARVLCRSTLPYTLDLVLTAVRREPRVLETMLSGDLTGRVRWTLAGERGATRLTWEQDVTVDGLLAVAAYAARPLLVWNHRRMLDDGIAGLRREVDRRVRGAARPG
jgi:hypothetical protein